MTAAQTWPEGVIARYLTVGGATVDIQQTVVEREEGERGLKPIGSGFSIRQSPRAVVDLMLIAECQGCKDNDETEHEGLHPSVLDRVLESHYGRDAQKWAQSHAESCRAIPAPGGE